MKKLEFSIEINAAKQQVWNALWNDAAYRQWTRVFNEGSYMEVKDWREGEKVYFLSPGGDGMYSTISRYVPEEYVSFLHLGYLKDGKEQPVDNETKSWAGATESYSLQEQDGKTLLTATVDITEDHAAFFNDVFPKGLAIVKQLAEVN